MAKCFDWSLYTRLSEELLKFAESHSDLSEASFRCAISRAYYGAFCSARNLLTKTGISVRRNDAHSAVINEYKNNPERIYKNIGTKLNRLRGARLEVDYENFGNIDCNKTKGLIDTSNFIIKNLNKYPEYKN